VNEGPVWGSLGALATSALLAFAEPLAAIEAAADQSQSFNCGAANVQI